MTAPAFEVGQDVIVLTHHQWNNDRARSRASGGHPAKVVKLGRTLAHVETPGGATYRVDLVTGVERGDFPALVTTAEREAEHAARLALTDELGGLGVELYRVRRELSTATLTAIRDLVAAEVRA